MLDRTPSRTAHPVPGALVAGRDERGASIRIALFYFLVCAVVGAVVLTAATVTTGQLVALERSQQAYYSVSSAAELLRDGIVGGTCTPAGACALPAQAKNAEGREAMQNWLSGMAQKVSDTKATVTSTFEASLSQVAETPVGKSVIDVSVTATMKADYSLHFSLRPKTYAESVGDYRITLDIPAALLHDESGNTVERITWERAIVGKPLEAEGGAGA